VRLAVLIVIGLLFIIFSIANAATVEVNLLFAKAAMPCFILLIGTFALGLLCGWLLRPRRRRAGPTEAA
jgi:uncharacterized integral membrane protein